MGSDAAMQLLCACPQPCIPEAVALISAVHASMLRPRMPSLRPQPRPCHARGSSRHMLAGSSSACRSHVRRSTSITGRHAH